MILFLFPYRVRMVLASLMSIYMLAVLGWAAVQIATGHSTIEGAAACACAYGVILFLAAFAASLPAIVARLSK